MQSRLCLGEQSVMSIMGASVSDDAYHTVMLILSIKVNTGALHGNTITNG